MLTMLRPLRPLLVAATVGAAVIALSAPSGAVPGATITLGSATIDPGASTTITVVFDSTGTDPQVLTVGVAPKTGAVGTFELTVDSTSTTSPGGGGWNCAQSLSDPALVECLWNNVSKDVDQTATVTVTAKASADALGPFLVTAQDETLEPEVLNTADLQVGSTPDTPVEPPVELSPNFTG